VVSIVFEDKNQSATYWVSVSIRARRDSIGVRRTDVQRPRLRSNSEGGTGAIGHHDHLRLAP
jgi:hypothetical protein